MSSPFPQIPVTFPPIGNIIPSLFQAPSSFTSGEQSVLQNLADSVAGFNPSVISAGAQDLLKTEVSLNSSGLSLQQLTSELIPFQTVLSSSQNIANLNAIATSQYLPSFLSNLLPNTSGLIATLNAFSQSGLPTGSITNPTYLFPLPAGGTFSQLVQTLLTWVTSPGSVVANIFLAGSSSSTGQSIAMGGGGTSSLLATSVFNTLNGQAGGPTGTVAQGMVRPFVNAIFGTNPSTNNATDPFDTLYSIVNNPTTYFSGLFSTTAIGNGITPQKLIADLLSNPTQFAVDLNTAIFSSTPIANNINPQQLITTLISNPTQFPVTLLNAIAPQFTSSWFQSLFSQTVPFTNGQSMFATVHDMFTNPQSVPCDILSLINISKYVPSLATFNGVTTNGNITSLCQMISGLLTNFAQSAGTLFTGEPVNVGSGLSMLISNDKVQYGSNTFNGFTSTGYYNSGVGPSPPSGGFFMPGVPGLLGFILANIVTGLGEIQYGANNGFPLQQLFSGVLFLGNALMSMVMAMGNMAATFANPLNLLNQGSVSGQFPGIPTTPSAWFGASGSIMGSALGLPLGNNGSFL